MNQNSNSRQETEKDSQIRFDVDPELKRNFKIFCALNDTNQTEYLTVCVEKAVESIKK